MVCRGRRQYPLDPRRCYILLVRPRVVCTLRSVSKCLVYNIEKVYKTNPTQIRTITTKYVPSLERIRIVQITTRHSCETLKVLREKSQVYPQEKQEEMSLSVVFRILTTSLFTYPEIESPKNSKNSSHTQYIMEVSYHIISLECICSSQLVLPQGLDYLFSKYLKAIFEYRV